MDNNDLVLRTAKTDFSNPRVEEWLEYVLIELKDTCHIEVYGAYCAIGTQGFGQIKPPSMTTKFADYGKFDDANADHQMAKAFLRLEKKDGFEELGVRLAVTVALVDAKNLEAKMWQCQIERALEIMLAWCLGIINGHQAIDAGQGASFSFSRVFDKWKTAAPERAVHANQGS